MKGIFVEIIFKTTKILHILQGKMAKYRQISNTKGMVKIHHHHPNAGLEGQQYPNPPQNGYGYDRNNASNPY